MDITTRAARLAGALLFDRISDEPRWAGACPECARAGALELSVSGDTLLLACVSCGVERNWRKVEEDVFRPAWEVAENGESYDIDVGIGRVLPFGDPAWWRGVVDSGDWLAEPLLPFARSIALYAPAKAGKSSIVLAVVTAMATGRPVFGAHPLVKKRSTLYLDYEMTEGDVLERLESMGFSVEDALDEHLIYVVAPSLPPLDTLEGGQRLLSLASTLGVQLVVIDTLTRAVKGHENEAETIRDFYRWTGAPLKAAGIALLRADHAGKDVERGMRGTSGKADDVDVVWQLTRTETGVVIKRTHTRLSWVPEEVILDYREDEDGKVSIDAGLVPVPHGTTEMVKLLDRLAIEPSVSAREAARLLRAGGEKGKTLVINAAQKTRRERALRDLSGGLKVIPIGDSASNVVALPGRRESHTRTPLSESRESLTDHGESPLTPDASRLVFNEGNTTDRKHFREEDDDAPW